MAGARRRYVRVAICVTPVILWSSQVSAQYDGNHEPPSFSEWVGDPSLALINMAVAGLGAAVHQGVRGGDVKRAVLRGAVGGLVTYSGKYVAGYEFSGSRLLARQISSVGVSITVNAGEGRGWLERLHFPLGPVALEVDRSPGGVAVYPSVSVHDLARMGEAAFDDRVRIDWQESLLSGAMVYDACCGLLTENNADGATKLGSVVYVETWGRDMRNRVLDHELVHVLHTDFLNRVIFFPLESWIVDAVVGPGRLPRYVRPNFLYPTTRQAMGMVGVAETGIPPLELEAEWIEWVHRQQAR